MRKTKFRFNNLLLASRFVASYGIRKIEYPAITGHLEKKYGTPLFTDPFIDLHHWSIKDAGEWGSAISANICTYVSGNVSLKQGHDSNSILITTTPEPATGRDWEGHPVSKPASSGFIQSKFLVKPGQVVSATVNTSQSYAGSWFAFWLIKKEVEGDERYREMDIFEKFMNRDFQKQYTMTVHGGTNASREMMNFHYPLFMADERKLTFTCELYFNKVKVMVNGIHLFLAEEPDFDGEYYVVFNDAPTTHGDKVKQEDVLKLLPRSFEIMDFRVFEPA